MKKKIKLLHDEQEFLFLVNPKQLKINYEIIEEKEASDDVSEIVIKISGKTLHRKPDEVSKIIDIPEEASYMKFILKEKNGINKLVGPFIHKISEDSKAEIQNPLLSKTTENNKPTKIPIEKTKD